VRRALAALLLLGLAIGCRRHRAHRAIKQPRPDAGSAAWIAERPTARESDEEALVRGAIYDCSGAPTVACADAETPLSGLEHAAELFIDGNHHGPDAAALETARDALAAAHAVDPATLSVEERIAGQGVALRIALGALPSDRAVAGSTRTLIAKLALPAKELERLGSEPSAELDALIGPRAQWIEKKPVFIPLLHEQLFHATMAFRAVQHGELRAVFGQFIAIDRDGRPHITPVIGELELRRGTSLAAPACALVHDVRRARCGAPSGLRAVMSPDDLPRAPFFLKRPEGRVGCPTCHSRGSAFSLATLEGSVTAHLAERRKPLLARVERDLELLRVSSP